MDGASSSHQSAEMLGFNDPVYSDWTLKFKVAEEMSSPSNKKSKVRRECTLCQRGNSREELGIFPVSVFPDVVPCTLPGEAILPKPGEYVLDI